MNPTISNARHLSAEFSFTPTLTCPAVLAHARGRWEGENCIQFLEELSGEICRANAGKNRGRRLLSLLPEGAGQGEGERWNCFQRQ